MVSGIIGICVLVILIGVLIAKFREADMYNVYNDYDEDEVIVTTTTTTTNNDTGPDYVVVGQLEVSYDGNQPFVVDPADDAKIWINDGDDLYEDANGQIWQLQY